MDKKESLTESLNITVKVVFELAYTVIVNTFSETNDILEDSFTYGVWFVAKFNKGYLNAITYFYCINLPFDMTLYKIVSMS